jgi:hypothetical protein
VFSFRLCVLAALAGVTLGAAATELGAKCLTLDCQLAGTTLYLSLTLMRCWNTPRLIIQLLVAILLVT